MQKINLTPLVRFLEVLPNSGDKELGLLKAHLVIEEVLTKIICKNSKKEKYIHEAKLQFHQKMKIVRAISEVQNAPWLWHALKLLNQARNELSHNLTTEELSSKIELFTSHIKAQQPKLFEADESEKFTNFHMAAFATYIPLASYANFDPANVKVRTILGGEYA